MSLFEGYEFFFYLIILLIPAIVLGLLEKDLKWYRCFISIFFIWQVFKDTKLQLIYLLAYVVFATYLVKIYLYLRTRFGRNKYIYGHAIALAIMPLVIYKVSILKGFSFFGFLGISYICFRIVQVIIESYDGVITSINEIQFIEFLLFFPTLSSGPIDRSRRFIEDNNKIWKKEEYSDLIYTGIFKIVQGVFYKVVCSGLLYSALQKYFEDNRSLLGLIGYAYVYGFYLFFDFAGYSLMAIGTSYILGIRTPENFNKPFLSIDIKDFWSRWHITLSTWFRDFIFTRFIVDSVRKKRFSNRLTTAAVGFLINMGIMGLWHGLEKHYIAYGLYHGCLLAVVEVYQKKSLFYKKNKDKKWYIACSWLVNINAVMFGFLIFSGHLFA